ncbi:MAG: hypothetical protein Tsb0020_20110 [Haliangiales bacterium]
MRGWYDAAMPPLTHFRARFRCLEDVEIDFTSPTDGSPVPFMAIVGPNGAGKTTILEAIATVLWSALQRKPPALQVGDTIEIGSAHGPLRLEQMQGHLGCQILDWRGDEIQSHSQHDKLIALGFDRALFIRSGYLPKMAAGTPLSPDPARGMNLDQALLPEMHEQRVAAVHQWWLHQHWEYPLTTVLDRLWDALTPFLGDRLYAGVDPHDHLPRFDIGTTRVGFNDLSSGERRIVLLFMEIVMQCGEDGLVLFDEPEAHFHPKWQTLLPEALCKLVPHGQVIVATHAPNIVDGLAAQQMLVLGEKPW